LCVLEFSIRPHTKNLEFRIFLNKILKISSKKSGMAITLTK
jgi:hypothetical protein